MSTFRLAALAALLVGLPAPLLAEDGRQSGSGITEEIIVTATYRETNLMDTAQSINAITDDFVEDVGAQSMADVFMMVPGLNMTGSRDGDNRYSVRGLTSQTGQTGYYLVGASVGVYLDGTPVTAALGPDNQVSGNLFDLERVEVLKGPQGTLFGEGSQGGTIRYLYKQPDTTRFDAGFNMNYSEMAESKDSSNRLDAMVNVPFGDGWALRLAGWRSETGGWIENTEPYEEDYNDGETTGGRAVLKYEGDRYAVTGSYYRNEQGTTGGSATVGPYTARTFRIPGLPPESSDTLDIYSFIVEVDFAWANFQSLTSFVDRSIEATYEFSLESRDGLDFFYGGASQAQDHPKCHTQALCYAYPGGYPGFFNLGDPNSTIPDGNNLVGLVGFIDSYSERWVQEFRLVSPGDRRLRWTVGAFWKDSEDHSQAQQEGLYFPGRYETFGRLLDTLLMVPANTHTDTLEEYAVFGEVTYDLTDTLEATVGVRVSSLEQYFSNTLSGTDDSPVSPKFNLSWRPRNDMLVYFNYATGFRPGNVNNHMEFNARQYDLKLIPARLALGLDATDLYEGKALALARRFFDGDEVANYEVGFKSTFFDGRVRLMASVYYLDWKDMIVVETDPVLGDQGNQLNFYNTNSGGAEIQGVELEIVAFLTERFSIRVAGDVNDTAVQEAPLFARGFEDDNELIYAPNQSVSIALDYDIPLRNGWMVSLHADHSIVDEQFTNTANTRMIPEWDKTNARITARKDQWRVALYSTNLTNEEIIRNLQGASTYYWHTPRQIGIEVGYSMH